MFRLFWKVWMWGLFLVLAILKGLNVRAFQYFALFFSRVWMWDLFHILPIFKGLNVRDFLCFGYFQRVKCENFSRFYFRYFEGSKCESFSMLWSFCKVYKEGLCLTYCRRKKSIPVSGVWRSKKSPDWAMFSLYIIYI